MMDPDPIDLEHVGKHCSVAICNVHDLLPIKCPLCQAVFCRDHVATDKHSPCAAASSISKSPLTEWAKRAECEVVNCTKPTLSSAFDGAKSTVDDLNDGVCVRCKGAFCVEHRHASSHACSGPLPLSKSLKNPAAQALLAKHFPQAPSRGTPAVSSSTSSVARPGKSTTTDPIKLARANAIELMKMRHRAKPGDPKEKMSNIPLEKRIHISVTTEGMDVPPQVLWFRKDLVAGKALDILCTQFKITGSPLSLLLTDTEEPLVLGMSLGEQLKEGSSLVVKKS